MIAPHPDVACLSAFLKNDHVSSAAAVGAVLVGGEEGLDGWLGVAVHDFYIERSTLIESYHLALSEIRFDPVQGQSSHGDVTPAIEVEGKVSLRGQQGRSLTLNRQILVILQLEVVPGCRIVAESVGLVLKDHGTRNAIRLGRIEGFPDGGAIIMNSVAASTKIRDSQHPVILGEYIEVGDLHAIVAGVVSRSAVEAETQQHAGISRFDLRMSSGPFFLEDGALVASPVFAVICTDRLPLDGQHHAVAVSGSAAGGEADAFGARQVRWQLQQHITLQPIFPQGMQGPDRAVLMARSLAMACTEVGSGVFRRAQWAGGLPARLNRGWRDGLHEFGKVRAQRHFVSSHHQRGGIDIIGEIKGRGELRALVADGVFLDPNIAAVFHHDGYRSGTLATPCLDRVVADDASVEVGQAHRGIWPLAEGVVLNGDVLRRCAPAIDADLDRDQPGVAKGVVADGGVSGEGALVKGANLVVEPHAGAADAIDRVALEQPASAARQQGVPTLGEEAVVAHDVVLAGGVEVVEAGEVQLVAAAGKEVTFLVQGKSGDRLVEGDDAPLPAASLRVLLKLHFRDLQAACHDAGNRRVGHQLVPHTG